MKFAALIFGLFERRHWGIVAAIPLLTAAVWMPDLTLQRSVFSYIVTFDITQSMDVEDVSLDDTPISRLNFARAVMRESLVRLPCGSKIGWGVFTGQSTLLLLPPIEVCSNYDGLLASLDSIDGRMRWTNWSRIAEGGVYSAARTAQSVGHDTKVIFFTDGQEAPPILPSDERVRDITRGQVKGWLFGVGGDQPAAIPRTDENGNHIGYWRAEDVLQVPPQPGANVAVESHEELSELRGQYLASVATRTGFEYRRIRVQQDADAAMLDMRLAHREFVLTDLNWLPAAVALVLLAWRFFPERWAARRPVWRFRSRG